MPQPTAVLDASVLFQEPIRSLLRKGVVTPQPWIALRNAMTAAFPDAELDQGAVDAMEAEMPNHPKDRHVLAAAVAGGVDLIVTNNQRHFPAADLARVGKRSLDADAFLCELITRSPHLVHRALNLQVEHMRIPRQWTLAELAGRLQGLGVGDPLARAFVEQLKKRFAIAPLPPPSV